MGHPICVRFEATSNDAEPYLSFELFTRTPIPPDLAKTRRFQRDPDTTKFARQPVDDTVPFSPFEGAELAIMSAVAPVANRRVEDDSIEIEIVESGEIARVEALPESSIEISSSALEPLDPPIDEVDPRVVTDQDRWAATVQLPASAFRQLEEPQPIESPFPPLAERLDIAAQSFAPPARAAWKLPLAIVLFLLAAFACGLGAAFALS